MCNQPFFSEKLSSMQSLIICHLDRIVKVWLGCFLSCRLWEFQLVVCTFKWQLTDGMAGCGEWWRRRCYCVIGHLRSANSTGPTKPRVCWESKDSSREHHRHHQYLRPPSTFDYGAQWPDSRILAHCLVHSKRSSHLREAKVLEG